MNLPKERFPNTNYSVAEDTPEFGEVDHADTLWGASNAQKEAAQIFRHSKTIYYSFDGIQWFKTHYNDLVEFGNLEKMPSWPRSKIVKPLVPLAEAFPKYYYADKVVLDRDEAVVYIERKTSLLESEWLYYDLDTVKLDGNQDYTRLKLPEDADEFLKFFAATAQLPYHSGYH